MASVPTARAVGDDEDFDLWTDDGVRLRARWRAHPEARATAVLVHGFSASCEDSGVDRLGADLHDAGLHVLTYDARGHGRSGGQCAVGSTEHLDVASATTRAKMPGLPIVLIGVSMGAIAVVRHLADAPDILLGVAGAVLVSAPARWRMRLSPVGLLNATLTHSRPGRWAAARWLHVRVAPRWRTGETPESMVRRVRLPVAVVHGAGDRLLATTHGRRLRRSAAGPAQLNLVAGMGHGLDDASRSAVVSAVRWVLASGHRQDGAGPSGPSGRVAVEEQP